MVSGSNKKTSKKNSDVHQNYLQNKISGFSSDENISTLSLSIEALKDLRIAISKSYGGDFEVSLSDDEVNEIGDLLLNILAESLKKRMRVAVPEL